MLGDRRVGSNLADLLPRTFGDGAAEISLVAADAARPPRAHAHQSPEHDSDRNRHRPRLLGAGPFRGGLPTGIWRKSIDDTGAWKNSGPVTAGFRFLHSATAGGG